MRFRPAKSFLRSASADAGLVGGIPDRVGDVVDIDLGEDLVDGARLPAQPPLHQVDLRVAKDMDAEVGRLTLRIVNRLLPCIQPTDHPFDGLMP